MAKEKDPAHGRAFMAITSYKTFLILKPPQKNIKRFFRHCQPGKRKRVKHINYGIGYRGSKNKTATKIVEQLPPATNFVDLFAGGCAVTHAAILSGKYKHFYINDLETITDLFLNAVNGKYLNEKTWVSREDFFKWRNYDPYIKYCWSFGNNGLSYIYGKDIEELKRLFWCICFSDNTEERRKLISHIVAELTKQPGLNKTSHNYRGLQSLESLERLNRLNTLSTITTSINSTHLDYRAVTIPADAVVYCDPPYNNTRQPYQGHDRPGQFNTAEFWQWLKTQQTQRASAGVNFFVSEYTAPEEFSAVAQFQTTRHAAASITTTVTEKLFIYDLHNNTKGGKQ